MMMKIQPKPAIAGKIIIVTGASSGIGEATARAFAEAGATVILVARRFERLQALSAEIIRAGGHALAVPTDLRNRDQITHLVQTTLNTFYRIDVLANIAGWGRYDWFEELSPEDLRDQYEVNVLGLAELTRQVIPTMKAQRSGYILNMNSYASEIAVPPITVYASTKYALAKLSDGLRRELPGELRSSASTLAGSKTQSSTSMLPTRGIQFHGLPIGRVARTGSAPVRCAGGEPSVLSISVGFTPSQYFSTGSFQDGWIASAHFGCGKRHKELTGKPFPLARSPIFQAAVWTIGLLAGMTIARSLFQAKVLHRCDTEELISDESIQT
jgi:NADP-dependent 3-hydroxy acid dehydrogenase YdfG